MKLGIVGLPNVGKSTLFNAITKAGAESANYPFCTIDPNIGVVKVPDERLLVLEKMFNSKKVVYPSIEFCDIAGLVKGASTGEGLGNRFLSHIREVAAIIHVVRCFEDENITHVSGEINPVSDIETINMELILADSEVLERRLTKEAKFDKEEKAFLTKILEHLNAGQMARTLDLTKEEQEKIKGYNLLTIKPVIYCANISEDSIGTENDYVKAVKELAAQEHSGVVVISSKMEQEISELDDEDKEAFLEELGIAESGLDKLIKESYKLLGLISFLTAGEMESRAWTIKKGTKAPQAGGKIHTDIERGFIRVETIAYEELVKHGSMLAAKEAGKVRLEGKDYEVQDGDVVLFRFNV